MHQTQDLVVRANLPGVSGSSFILMDAPIENLAVHNPMINGFHPRHNLALHVRHCVHNDRGAFACWGPIHAFEAVCSGSETCEKMFHQWLVPFLREAVQHESVTHLHHRLNSSVLGHGHSEPQGLKGGLGDPGGDHGRLSCALGCSYHIQASRQLAKGLCRVICHGALDVCDLLLADKCLTQISAALLVRLEGALRGDGGHLQRGDRNHSVLIPEARVEDVHGFV
mmetsp:Transcript_32185/g.44649  ORF Transcript_32185/g.44649 Transcript_32185/m.44649 type:complete len:225 (-) Transcript_32185:1335-2009(-)